MDLSQQKCEACEGLKSALSPDEVKQYLHQVSGWEAKDNKSIEKTFKFPNFVDTMKFANRIAGIAEEQNHHPDLHVSYGKLRVEISTHHIGGLSPNDFILAAKIDELGESANVEAQAI